MSARGSQRAGSRTAPADRREYARSHQDAAWRGGRSGASVVDGHRSIGGAAIALVGARVETKSETVRSHAAMSNVGIVLGYGFAALQWRPSDEMDSQFRSAAPPPRAELFRARRGHTVQRRR